MKTSKRTEHIVVAGEGDDAFKVTVDVGENGLPEWVSVSANGKTETFDAVLFERTAAVLDAIRFDLSDAARDTRTCADHGRFLVDAKRKSPWTCPTCKPDAAAEVRS
jgi:hypothetical protein